MIAALCVFSFALAFGRQQHLGSSEKVEHVSAAKKTRSEHPLCTGACQASADKKYCESLCLHLPAINQLAYKNGVGIFFRNGMLLGLVREHGFLKGEIQNPDPDLACLESDIPKIQQIEKKGGWGDYTIEFSQTNNEKGEFSSSFHDVFDGRHPLTHERMQFDQFIITHKPSKFKLDGGIWAAFDPDKKYLWYPLFVTPGKHFEKEYALGVKYNAAGGGPKMLFGVDNIKDLPPTMAEFKDLVNAPASDNKPNPKGLIGEVYPSFAGLPPNKRYTQFEWYDFKIWAPSNSVEILKAGYGNNCLVHSIDKNHDNKETDMGETTATTTTTTATTATTTTTTTTTTATAAKETDKTEVKNDNTEIKEIDKTDFRLETDKTEVKETGKAGKAGKTKVKETEKAEVKDSAQTDFRMV